MGGTRFTQEQKRWLEQNAIKYSEFKDLTNDFNKHFNLNDKVYRIRDYCKSNEIKKSPSKIKYVYPKEEINWLRENRKIYTIEELTKKYNEKYNMQKSSTAIEKVCQINDIHRNNYVENFNYNEEYDDWLKENYSSYTIKELMELSIKKFGVSPTLKSIETRVGNKYLKLKKEEPRLFLGNKIGHEFVRKNAVYIKVSTNKTIDEKGNKISYSKTMNYRRKANVEYEKHYNVKLDDKIHYVVCIDRNIHNFAKENLMLLNKEEFMMYNGKKTNFEFRNNKLNKLLLDVVKLEHIIKNERKENEK